MTVLDLDTLTAEETREPFRFKLGGQEWALPHPADLTLRQQVSIDTGGEIPVLRTVGLRVAEDGSFEPAGDALMEILLDRRGTVEGKLLVAWLAHAGVAKGESAASSR